MDNFKKIDTSRIASQSYPPPPLAPGNPQDAPGSPNLLQTPPYAPLASNPFTGDYTPPLAVETPPYAPPREDYTQNPPAPPVAYFSYENNMPQSSNKTMAIISLVLAFIFAPIGIVLAIISANRAHKGQGSFGLALTSVILNSVTIGFQLLFMIIFFTSLIFINGQPY